MPSWSATSFWVYSRPPARPKRRVMICFSRGSSRSRAWRRSCRSTSASMGRITRSPSVPRMSERSSSLPSQSVFSGSSKESSAFWAAVFLRYMRISFSMQREA